MNTPSDESPRSEQAEEAAKIEDLDAPDADAETVTGGDQTPNSIAAGTGSGAGKLD